MKIREIKKKDIANLYDFFSICFIDITVREDIDIPNFVEDEIKNAMRKVEAFLEGSKESLFFVATMNGKIVGTISYTESSQLIRDINPSSSTSPSYEIGSVYIHPRYQKRGIGGTLLTYISTFLKITGDYDFYLDSGYRTAQVYWKKKLGEPLLISYNHWGKGIHHMLWHVTEKAK